MPSLAPATHLDLELLSVRVTDQEGEALLKDRVVGALADSGLLLAVAHMKSHEGVRDGLAGAEHGGQVRLSGLSRSFVLRKAMPWMSDILHTYYVTIHNVNVCLLPAGKLFEMMTMNLGAFTNFLEFFKRLQTFKVLSNSTSF